MIIFQNPGLIDVRAVTTFGVSVKETDSAIGKFGTGLKYAIAVILREGGSITIWRGLTAYEFATEPTDIKGKTFDIVRMEWEDEEGNFNSVPLAFTTEHGKMWEPWQAFRELWSNMKDEGGRCWHVDETNSQQWYTDKPTEENIHIPEDSTTIVVTGEAMEKAWEERSQTILETEPMKALDGVEVHPGNGKSLYYQGIRVYDLQKPAKFNYNLLNHQLLSEDRKILYHHIPTSHITKAILTSSWSQLIEAALTAGDGFFEGNLPWKDHTTVVPSPTFVEVAQGLRDERRLAGTAKSLFSDLAKTMQTHYGYSDPREVVLSSVEKAIIERAAELVKSANIDVSGMNWRARSGWSNDTKVILSSDEKSVIFNSAELLNGDHEQIAKLIVRAMAMKAGGKVIDQLTNFILFGVFEQKEVDFENTEEWYD